MTMQTEEDARAFCAALTDAAGVKRLDRLTEMVVEENARQNLMSKASEGSIWRRHIADSAQLLRYIPRETGDGADGGAPWLDLGTGAGFPGLVIAALRRERRIILVESRKKRVDWLLRAAAELDLSNCHVEGRRLEQVETLQARVISARAFAPLPKLVALSARFSTRQTVWLLPKGRSAVQEVNSLPSSLAAMFHVEPSVTDAEAGIVIGTGRVAGA